MRITKRAIQRALSEDDPWRIGNETLYDLCRRYPRHERDAEIVAKVWLIGRAYSASIERGRGKAAASDLSNDRFYTETVPKILAASELDQRLQNLQEPQGIDESNVHAVLGVHAYLVRLFHRLTKKNKRSLASKYLHFHRPDFFFIYDSRAAAAIRALGIRQKAVEVRGVDPAYSGFVGAALRLREQVFTEFGHKLGPRQLDRLLLGIHEDV
jgi:hypothetical protein